MLISRRKCRRTYFQVTTEEGAPLTIYHDDAADAWFRQEY
jgi:hypothetical protein